MGFNLTPAGLPGIGGSSISLKSNWSSAKKNYWVSYYIAEWWNSLSNAFYACLSIIGLCACILVYNILLTFPPEKRRMLTAVSLSFYAVAVTVLYLYIINPVFHQVSYGLLVSIMVFVPIFQIRHISTIQPKGIATKIAFLYLFSVATYMGGFAIWNFENFNCDAVRQTREIVGYPVRSWHLGTGLGTYGSVLMQIYLRQLALGRQDVKLIWAPLPFLISDLSREQILKKNSQKTKKKRH
ncbi:ceramidase-domain-containing protein [Chytridium lagenaria]|nr:ceramidase-domain-containing protein [Chytridium lagenaria]